MAKQLSPERKEELLGYAKEELRAIREAEKSKLVIAAETAVQPSEDAYLKDLVYEFEDGTIPIKGTSSLVTSISPGFDRFGINIIITFKDGKTRVSRRWT